MWCSEALICGVLVWICEGGRLYEINYGSVVSWLLAGSLGDASVRGFFGSWSCGVSVYLSNEHSSNTWSVVLYAEKKLVFYRYCSRYLHGG